jgi:dTDP-4-amino-4,6-dideoxygalactose transaminase
VSEQQIPVSKVDVGPAEEELVLRVLRSGQLAQGAMVAELEGRFAEIAGVRHAVAVSNGTVALEVSLEALRHLEVVRAGDEVLTSAFTFVATANAIVHAGLTARFADIGQDYCLDPAVVTERLTDRTRVLLPVHLYGLPADMTALEQLVRERGLFVVEDAAQALGATVGERAVGSYGLGCFSLYATKNVTSGEGGMITTDSDELAELLRLLRNQGMRDRYEYLVVGHNHRMTDLQAAVALGQLGRFEATNAARRRNAERLSAALAGLPGLVPPAEPAGRRSVWHQFTVRVTEEAALGRDELATRLREHGIGSGVYYPRAVFDYGCFDGHPQVVHDPAPLTATAAEQVLSLPVHPLVGDDGIDRIGTVLRQLLDA